MWNILRIEDFAGTRRKAQGAGRKERGFSLLEVMVAMAILATAFTAVLKLHSDAMDMVIAGRMHTQGAELAQYKLTEIELGGLEALEFQSGEFGEMAPQYAWDIDIEPTPLESWTKVTVKVNNIHMRARGEFQLTTYLPSSKPDEEKKETTK
jgi:general secretion pathway protein I